MGEPVLGAIYLTEGDSVTGWCWCASRRQTQCRVEVLIDGTPWRELIADRRAEGVRLNGPPHDHFGFLVALPPRTDRPWHRIEAREKRTGLVFGRLVQGGGDPAVAAYERRIEAIRRGSETLRRAIAGTLTPLSAASRFGAVGRALLGGAPGPVDLTLRTPPAVSLILTGCATAAAAARAVSGLAVAAGDLRAELLLLGELGDLDGLGELLGRVRGLRLIDAADGGLTAAFATASAEWMLVIDGVRLDAGCDLGRFLGEGVVAGPRVAAAAAALGVPLAVCEAAESGLVVALTRKDWQSMAAFEADDVEEAALDLVLQAGLLGLRVRGVGPLADAAPRAAPRLRARWGL